MRTLASARQTESSVMRRIEAACAILPRTPWLQRHASAASTTGRAYRAPPQRPVTPCGVDGGPYEHFLQKALERKEHELDEERKAALHFLLGLGRHPSDITTTDAKVDSALLTKMAKAVNILESADHQRVQAGIYKDSCVFHLTQPEGRVEVPLTVGFAYVELWQQGYDADAWWRGYYRNFVLPQQQLQAPPVSGPVVSSLDAEGCKDDQQREKMLQSDRGETSTADAAGDVVPPLYWLHSTGANTSGKSERRFLYVTPQPFFMKPRDGADGGAGDAASEPQCDGCVAEEKIPYWIPVSLAMHLPFFPIPHPRAAGEGNELAGGGFTLSDPEADPDDAEEAPVMSALRHGSVDDEQSFTADSGIAPRASEHFDQKDAAIATAGVTFQSRNNAEHVNWGHVFYDELYMNNSRSRYRPEHSAIPRSSYGDWAATATSGQRWDRAWRATLPFQAPWFEVPLLASDAGKKGEQLTACETKKTKVTAAAASSASANPAWPSPLLSLHLFSSYQRGISSFWASKANPASNLPQPYFFPATAFPFLYTRLFQSSKTLKLQPWYRPLDRREEREAAMSGQAKRGAVRESVERAASPFAALGTKWRSNIVTYFGQSYIAVGRTTLACFFDSSLCSQHSIPLAVTGSPHFYIIAIVRHRQQRPSVSSTLSDVHIPELALPLPRKPAAGPRTRHAESRQGTQTPAGTTATRTDQMAPLRASPWLTRLRSVQLERSLSHHSGPTAAGGRIMQLRHQLQRFFFLFRSPYWVEVEDLYERWGVHVAPGVIPLSTPIGLFVNAEQTTNASVFTPATCVPHLAQKILLRDGLARCSWAMSQQLLSVRAPLTRPRRRGPRAVCAWTYESLKARAAAAQEVPNVWVADEMVRLMGWTLRPVAVVGGQPGWNAGPKLHETVTNTIAHASVPLQSISAKKQRLRLQEELNANLSGTATTTDTPYSCSAPSALLQASEPPRRDSFTVFHCNCIAEQAELEFIATFAPQVLLLRVPDPSKEVLDALSACRSFEAQRLLSSIPKEEVSRMLTDTVTEKSTVESYADSEGNTGEDKKKPLQVKLRLFLAGLRHKRQLLELPWRKARLDGASRLELARVALRKGYSAKNAQKWVSVDFLRDEPRVRPAKRAHRSSSSSSATLHTSTSPTAESAAESVADELTAVEVTVVRDAMAAERSGHMSLNVEMPEKTPLFHEDREDSMLAEKFTEEKITLINAEELEWPTATSTADRFRWLWRML